jgi:hypothetical protein
MDSSQGVSLQILPCIRNDTALVMKFTESAMLGRLSGCEN